MNDSKKRKVNLEICSRDEALKRMNTSKYDAVFSIDNPPSARRGKAEVDRRNQEVRALVPNAEFFFFYDKPGRTSETNRRAVLNAARRIAAKSQELHDNARVLLHCVQGRCRSPAAAIVLLRAIGHTTEEARAIVKHLVPKSTPYEEMLELSK